MAKSEASVDENSWRPTTTCAALQRRSEIVWKIRQFFHDRGFAEVQTPVISHDTVVDLNIEPVRIPSRSLACPEAGAGELFLQTSPEFAMKRMLAAGMKAIYSIGPVFRAGERGSNHNPEFTMVEWYRVGDNFADGIKLLDELVQAAIESLPAEIITYQHAFIQHAGVDPLQANVAELAAVATQADLGVSTDWSEDADTWLDLIFSELVQPRIGLKRPMIVTHYPASQSALARLSADDSRTSECFELFVRGIELANGYHELLDAAELMARNRETEAKREELGRDKLPVSS